jgi:hypothetical protein
MTNKNKPQQVEATVETKATAALEVEIQKELDQDDKALASLLEDDEKDADENEDTAD